MKCRFCKYLTYIIESKISIAYSLTSTTVLQQQQLALRDPCCATSAPIDREVKQFARPDEYST